jgi:hypothetical protein
MLAGWLLVRHIAENQGIKALELIVDVGFGPAAIGADPERLVVYTPPAVFADENGL